MATPPSLLPDDAETVSDAQTPAARKSDRESLSVLVLLAVFTLLSVLWALTIPIPASLPNAAKWDGFNPDEQFHMRYIVYLATHFRLPIPWQGTEANGSNLYTAVHPPLFYALGAIVYRLGSPFLNYAKSLLLLRFVGSLVGASVVYVTYRTARRILPHDISLLAAGFVAGVPMFVSLAGAVTNEPLATLAAAMALMTMVYGLAEGFDRRRAFTLALWVTAGIAIKTTDLALFPAAALALLLAPRQKEESTERHPLPVQFLLLLMTPLIGIGWWFARNQIIYGDPLQGKQHYAFWSATVQRPWWTIMTVPQFFRNSSFIGWESFWGIFDAFARPMPDYAYELVMLLQGPAIVGFLIFLVRGGLRDKIIRHAALCLTLFAMLVLAVFYAVNWRIYSPQGRYLFPLLPVFGIAAAVGWTSLWKPRWRIVPIVLALFLLLALNLFAVLIMPIRPDTPGH